MFTPVFFSIVKSLAARAYVSSVKLQLCARMILASQLNESNCLARGEVNNLNEILLPSDCKLVRRLSAPFSHSFASNLQRASSSSVLLHPPEIIYNSSLFDKLSSSSHAGVLGDASIWSLEQHFHLENKYLTSLSNFPFTQHWASWLFRGSGEERLDQRHVLVVAKGKFNFPELERSFLRRTLKLFSISARRKLGE